MSDWKAKIKAKRREIDNLTPTEWKVGSLDIPAEDAFEKAIRTLLTPEQLEITSNFNAQELIFKIAKQEVSSEAVTLAFCKRAAIVNQFTSCLTEVSYDRAIERAKQLDEHLKETGTPVGPLHGLPISVKDSFEIEGLHSTLGCVSRLGLPVARKNTPLIQLLYDLGAVFYVKTNVPQGIITSDSHNNVFGRTLNPYNTSEWTAGGSSGGEGSLIALRGSVLGVGTDLAGSIRIPAWCCGVYGFKPTVNRVPYSGIATSGTDLADLGLIASAGPLATTLSDIEYFMKVVLDSQPWIGYDSLCIPMPWVDNKSAKKKDEKKYTIGVIIQDDMCPVDQEVQIALQSAASKLVEAGFSIVQLLPDAYPSFHTISRTIALPLLDIDSNRTSLKTVMAGHEPLVPSVKKIFHGLYSPSSLSLSNPDEEIIIESVADGSMTIKDTVEATKRQLTARKAWLDLMNVSNIDALICPCAAQFAPAFDTYNELPYTNNWNTLDVRKSKVHLLTLTLC